VWVWVCVHTVYLHHVPQIQSQLGLGGEGVAGASPEHIGVAVLMLSVPGVLIWGADSVMRWAQGQAAEPLLSRSGVPLALLFETHHSACSI
jgi:hypothetical protein